MARKERILIVADSAVRGSMSEIAEADLVIALSPEPKHRWAHAEDVEVEVDPRIQIEAG